MEVRPAPRLLANRLDHDWVGVAENHGSGAQLVIGELAPVDRPQLRTFTSISDEGNVIRILYVAEDPPAISSRTGLAWFAVMMAFFPIRKVD
jgi:hypothetical protein